MLLLPPNASALTQLTLFDAFLVSFGDSVICVVRNSDPHPENRHTVTPQENARGESPPT